MHTTIKKQNKTITSETTAYGKGPVGWRVPTLPLRSDTISSLKSGQDSQKLTHAI